MVLVAFEAEVTRFDQAQPLRLVHASLGEFRYTVRNHQFWHWERLAGQLFVEHVQVVFIHVGITDEVGEPARRVTGQATDQAQQRSTFGQVERRAQAQIVGADVKGQGNFLGLDIRVELVQQMAILRTK